MTNATQVLESGVGDQNDHLGLTVEVSLCLALCPRVEEQRMKFSPGLFLLP